MVISSFNIDIPDALDLPKKEISLILCNKLLELKEDSIKEVDEYFYVSSKTELLEYLSRPNQSKTLTIKEKSDVMLTAKKIIAYCKNSFFLTPYNYESFEDLLVEAEYIKKFGDIPSCRRAISLLNNDPKLDYKIDIVLSKRTKKELDKKNRIKMNSVPRATIKYGKFLITFD